jgi:hypothetical protein
MSYTEILKTSDDGRYRVLLIADEYPDEPYDDGQSPLLRLDNSGAYGTIRAEHVMATGRPLDDDARIEEAAERWGTPYSDDWPLFEKYLRAYYGTTEIETWYSGSDWYVTYDTARWRNHVGAPPGSADMSEYRAWCEGDVWGYAVEQNVTWTRDDDPGQVMHTWETADSCWGFYGSDGANGKYLRECALEAFESVTATAGDSDTQAWIAGDTIGRGQATS